MIDRKKEIETIKERNITLSLSDADCERLYRLCGEHGLTVPQLLENFIGDLVDGTYTNGSDERMYAEQWFRRCWFGMFPEKTLLNYLLSYSCSYDVDDFLGLLDDIAEAQNDLAEYDKGSVDDDDLEEIEWIKDELNGKMDDLNEIKTDFAKENPEADWKEEVEKVRDWWKAKENLINE